VSYALAIALGGLAGVLAGMFGVGGGLLFVPVLVALGLDQHEATGTSLLAILPTVTAGARAQARYGSVRWGPALVLGVASIAAAQAGVLIAESLPAHVLRKLFAAFVLVVAAQLVLRVRRGQRPGSDVPELREGV
jgi:uncharacterized membrane protein YfcA